MEIIREVAIIINIDSSKCTGCGVCARNIRSNIILDGGQTTIIKKNVPKGFESVVQQVADNCPGRAIEIS